MPVFHKGLQASEIRLPEHSISAEPGIDGSQWSRIQLVIAVPTLTALLHQMGASQQTQVFRNRRSRDGKRPSDASSRQTALPQKVQHGATGGVGQCSEGNLS